MEFEAVLNVSQIQTKISQYKKLYNGGYGPLIKVMVYHKLTSDKIDLKLDCEKMTESPRLPQKSKQVSDLSSEGLERVPGSCHP